MPLTDLHHIAVRTLDVEATRKFYCDVLGMKEAFRPDLGFPGHWLLMGSTMIHTVGGEMAKDGAGKWVSGSGAVDHIALGGTGYDDMRDTFRKHGIEWRENAIPEAKIWQLFVKDPSGVFVEINFDASKEPPGTKGYDAAKALDPVSKF